MPDPIDEYIATLKGQSKGMKQTVPDAPRIHVGMPAERKPRVYSADISGPLMLHILNCVYVRVAFHVEPAEGQWTVGAAKERVEEAIRDGDVVLIENKAGEVVFRAEKGHVEFPLDQKRFWEGAGQ